MPATGIYTLLSVSPTRCLGAGRSSRRRSDCPVTQSGHLRHRRGVNESDGETYRKYADELTRFANGLVGPTDAPDVVADAVVSCLTSPIWAGVAEKRAYLYRSVLNRAAEFHRSTRRRRDREAGVARSEWIDPPDVRPEILAAVSRLSVQQRAVIFLTYWDDLDPRSVAGLLNISDGSVRRHLARARSHLRKVLKDDN